jgi:hypothetical protein
MRGLRDRAAGAGEMSCLSRRRAARARESVPLGAEEPRLQFAALSRTHSCGTKWYPKGPDNSYGANPTRLIDCQYTIAPPTLRRRRFEGPQRSTLHGFDANARRTSAGPLQAGRSVGAQRIRVRQRARSHEARRPHQARAAQRGAKRAAGPLRCRGAQGEDRAPRSPARTLNPSCTRAPVAGRSEPAGAIAPQAPSPAFSSRRSAR